MALSSLSTFHPLVKLHKSRHTSQFFSQNPPPLGLVSVGIQHHSSIDSLHVSGSFNTIHQISEDFTPVELLDILRTQKDPTSSLEILGWASKQENFVPAPFVYEEVLQQLGKNGSFNEMMDVIGCMKQSGAKIDQTTFFILIENYTRLSMFDEAVDVFKLMEEKGVEANTLSYNFLLNILVENSKLKLVEDVYAEMTTRGVCPDVSTFNILIKGLCKAHLIRPAISMMEEMMPCFGILPDEITFTTLMQGFIEEGNMKGALKMKARMIEMECSPTNVTINLLIHGFCKQGKVEEALGFIQKESSSSKQGSRFHPDRFTFNTLVNGLCQAGHVSHALEILDVMLQEGFDPDIITYNTLLSGLCKSGEIEDAIVLVDEMIRRNCLPNMVSYNTLISTLCARNRIEEAMELAYGLSDKGLKPDIFTFNALIGGLCKVGDHAVALELFNEMKEGGCLPDEFTYNVLIDHFCSSRRGKHIGIALDLLREMERSGCLRSVITYNTLIDGLCKNRRIEEAEEMFDQMDMQGISRDLVTYNSLIDGLCKNNRFNAAMELMDQMLMEGLKPDKLTYNSLLSYHCKNGDIKRAADVMQTMSSNGCEPDMITYGTLIGGLCKAGRTQVASKLLRSIQMKGMVLAPHAYNPVIQALFKQNKTKEAIRLFREMMEKGEPPDGLSYKIVFRGMCRGGGPIGEAVEFLMEMTEEGFIPEFTAFSMLAEGLLALAMEDTLVRVIDQVMMKSRFDDQEIAMVRGLIKIRKFHDGLMTLGISIPIGVIPAGSDNSLVWTILGIKDPISAAITIVKGGLTPTDVFAVEWIQTGIIHFGTTVTYFGFVSDVLELSEKYQKRFGPLRYFVAGFLKFLCLPKYTFELEYLPMSNEISDSEGKGLGDNEKTDMSDFYTDIMIRSRREGIHRTNSFSSIDSMMTPNRTPGGEIETGSTLASSEPSEFVRCLDLKSKRLSMGRNNLTDEPEEVIHPQSHISASNWPRTRSRSRKDKEWNGLTTANESRSSWAATNSNDREDISSTISDPGPYWDTEPKWDVEPRWITEQNWDAENHIELPGPQHVDIELGLKKEIAPKIEEKWIAKKGPLLGILLCNHACKTVQSTQVVAPNSEHDDGYLTLILVHGSGRLRLARFFLRLQCGGHLSLPFVEYVKVKAVKVKPGKICHHGCGIDGELISLNGQVICSVLPEQCRLIGHPASENHI